MIRALFLAALPLCIAASTVSAQWTTQSVEVRPGWNAVHVSVQPNAADCDSIFGGNSRVLSVRRWAPPPIEAVEYDSANGVTLPLSGSWLTWFPPTHPDRPLLNLSELAAGGAYLIQVSDGPSISLAWTGRPVAQAPGWAPAVHAFVGLPVHSSGVTFAAFFGGAGSNIVTDYRLGGEIYRVLSDGSHQRIFTPATTLISPGSAYWIKAQQYSTYAGPIALKVESPGGWLDFGSRPRPQYIEIKNVTSAPRGMRISHVPSEQPPSGTAPLAGPVPLRYAVITGPSESEGRTWQVLPPVWTTQLTAGASVRLALVPDATALAIGNTNAAFQSILEVTDDVGTAGVVRQRIGVRAAARAGTAAESRGLWVGEVNITDVGRLRMPLLNHDPSIPQRVARPFTFRLIAHVDAGGTARLLQRVFIGTRPDSTNGGVITDLIASESGVALYKAQNPGASVFRLSSANFPFMNPLALSSGAFGVPNQTVRGSVDLSRNDPANPFLHAYAPLHDNKERRAEDNIPYQEDVEVFSVRRAIELAFEGPDAISADPRWGDAIRGGVYRERIYGLGGALDDTERVIVTEGRFVLQRASTVGTLLQ